MSRSRENKQNKKWKVNSEKPTASPDYYSGFSAGRKNYPMDKNELEKKSEQFRVGYNKGLLSIEKNNENPYYNRGRTCASARTIYCKERNQPVNWEKFIKNKLKRNTDLSQEDYYALADGLLDWSEGKEPRKVKPSLLESIQRLEAFFQLSTANHSTQSVAYGLRDREKIQAKRPFDAINASMPSDEIESDDSQVRPNSGGR